MVSSLYKPLLVDHHGVVALGNNMKMRVGADESNVSSNEFDGRIQDVRVYFGACKYTATNIGDQAFSSSSNLPRYSPRHSIRCDWWF